MKRYGLMLAMVMPFILIAGFILGGSIFTVEGKEKSMKPSNIQVQPVDIQKAPDHIKQWVEKHRQTEGTYVKTQGNQTYLLVTWGEKKTGGYVVTIDKVVETKDEIVVYVSYQEPKGMVIQVITYPYDLVSIPATDKKVVFVKN